MTIKKLFVFFFMLSFLITFFLNTISLIFMQPTINVTNEIPAELVKQKVFSQSHYYVVNNNLAQYSTYLYQLMNPSIMEFRVEVFVFFNLKNVLNEENIKSIHDLNNHLKPNYYYCLVKILDLQFYSQKEEIIVLKSIEIQQFFFKNNAKLTFIFTPSLFNSYNLDPRNFNVQNIVIGVIYADDYDNFLTEKSFSESLDWINIHEYKKVVLPFTLINYQVPILINVHNEVSKSVSSCVHTTYEYFPSHLHSWIDIHLLLGVREIVIYDATSDEALTKGIRSYYSNDSRIVLKPYRINEKDFCPESITFNTDNIKINSLLKMNCKKFFEQEFKELAEVKEKHEQITANDCLLQLSKRHEYVAYYDLEELLLPRPVNQTLDSLYSCNQNSRICSLQNYTNFKDTDSSYYSYLESLVAKYKKNRDKHMLASILFQNAAFITSNNITERLFNNLNTLIEDIDTRKLIEYPLTVYLESELNYEGHKFIIQEKDVQHVRNLTRAYKDLNNCLLDTRLIKFKLDKIFQRFVYFVTEHEQSRPKSINYSRNVKALSISNPSESIPDAWILYTKPFHGDMLMNFRHTIHDWSSNNVNSSIKSLNIDFKYLSFIMTSFTDFCKT